MDTIHLQSYYPIKRKPKKFTSSFILLRRNWFCRGMTTRTPPEGGRRGVGSRLNRKSERLACTPCVFHSKTSVSPARRALLPPRRLCTHMRITWAPCTFASNKLIHHCPRFSMISNNAQWIFNDFLELSRGFSWIFTFPLDFH